MTSPVENASMSSTTALETPPTPTESTPVPSDISEAVKVYKEVQCLPEQYFNCSLFKDDNTGTDKLKGLLTGIKKTIVSCIYHVCIPAVSDKATSTTPTATRTVRTSCQMNSPASTTMLTETWINCSFNHPVLRSRSSTNPWHARTACSHNHILASLLNLRYQL